jgi:hypothetical protein
MSVLFILPVFEVNYCWFYCNFIPDSGSRNGLMMESSFGVSIIKETCVLAGRMASCDSGSPAYVPENATSTLPVSTSVSVVRNSTILQTEARGEHQNHWK